MDTIHTHAPLTPRRRVGSVVGAVAIAIAVVAVFFGVNRLVQNPTVVPRIEIHNPTGDIVDAMAANGWQIVSTAEKAGEVKWYLTKGTSTGKVEVENEHGALKIKLERNDK